MAEGKMTIHAQFEYLRVMQVKYRMASDRKSPQPTLRQTAQRPIAFGEMEATPAVLDKLGKISIATLGRIIQRIRPTERLPRAYPERRAETSAQQAMPISTCQIK